MIEDPQDLTDSLKTSLVFEKLGGFLVDGDARGFLAQVSSLDKELAIRGAAALSCVEFCPQTGGQRAIVLRESESADGGGAR